MEKKRIIFDLDGTLIPIADFRRGVITNFNECNISYSNEQLEGYMTGMKNYEYYCEKYTLQNYYDHLKRFSKMDFSVVVLLNFLNHPERIMPDKINSDVFILLEYLKKNEYDLVVLTNYFKVVQERRLILAGMLDYFTEVYGADLKAKPNSEAFSNACGIYDKKECLFVGDNYEVDYLGARNSGIDAVLTTNEDIKRLMKVL